jgi:hypothetical protein
VFEVSGSRYIAGHARVRNFRSFGVGAWEIAHDLAVAQAGEHFAAFKEGRHEPANAEWLRGLRQRTEGWVQQG